MQRRMKKYIFLLGLFMTVLILCACHKEKEVAAEKEPDFVYPAERIVSFCLDEESNLYTYEAGEECIRVYDKTGVQTKEIPIVLPEIGEYTSLCLGDGVLYAVVSAREGNLLLGSSLVEIALDDGSQRNLYENPYVFAVNKMELINGSLYLMEQEIMDLQEKALLDDWEGGYFYDGEKLKRFDLAAEEAEELPVDRIKGICKKDEESLWLYAYDAEVGEYYFAEYNGKTDTYGEKYHAGKAVNGFIWALAYDNSYEKLLYVDELKAAILAIEPAAANNQTSFLETKKRPENGNNLQYKDGYTYLLSAGKVTRVKNSNYIRDNKPLKIYSTSLYELPEGTGFNIALERVSAETMAMALMAGNSDYDLLMLSTAEPLAEQIRRIGAYEPLNKVDGVSQYFKTGFDYIKEAATAESGAVWMLPYEIDCELVLYNSEACARYGIDMETGYSYEKLMTARSVLAAKEASEPAYYEINLLYRDIWNQYLADYAVVNGSARFDTELFRSYSELVKKEYSQSTGVSWSIYNQVMPGNLIQMYGKTEEQLAAEFLKYFSNVAVAKVNKQKLSHLYGRIDDSALFGLLTYDFFEAKALPSLEEKKPQKNIAGATFLVLNPKSERLAEAKEYLSALAKRMTEEESIYRTKKLNGTYNAPEQKVHELYGNAKIVFSYPDDIFAEYLKYLNGEKTLDEVISELERKLNIYLRE